MTKNDKNTVPVQDFNLGGLANSRWSGQPNSLYKLTGFDVHSQPGLLRVAQKMVKNSGTVVTEFCKNSIQSTNGNSYWGSVDSGKIWQEASGTWTLVYTISAGAGESKILGMAEYNNYIYIATEKRLHRIPSDSSKAIGAANWTINFEANWATFDIGDLEFHPFLETNLVLYIGDGYQVAQVDAGVFSSNALDITAPLRIKCLGAVGTELLIGTFIDDNVNKTTLYIWDTFSESFADNKQIDEVGINAILKTDNMTLVQAGLGGRIYIYDQGSNSLQLYKVIPGDYNPTAWGRVNPDAVATLEGKMLFGFSQGLGNPADQGVYAIGRNSTDYPYILDLPYPISQRTGDDFELSDVEIGSILVVGFDVFVSWKHESAYGVDKLDYTQKVECAVLETRVISITRESASNYSGIVIAYYQLPSGTSVNLFLSKNYASYVQATTKVDATKNTIFAEKGVTGTTLQLKIKPVVSGNTAPEIESAGVTII
jgi:hypothetical protein